MILFFFFMILIKYENATNVLKCVLLFISAWTRQDFAINFSNSVIVSLYIQRTSTLIFSHDRSVQFIFHPSP